MRLDHLFRQNACTLYFVLWKYVAVCLTAERIFISLACTLSFSLASSAATQPVLPKMHQDTQNCAPLPLTRDVKWQLDRPPAALTAAETFNVSAHGQCANTSRGSQLSAQSHSVSSLFCFTNTLPWMSSCACIRTEHCGKLRKKKGSNLYIQQACCIMNSQLAPLSDILNVNSWCNNQKSEMIYCLKTICQISGTVRTHAGVSKCAT